MKISYAKTVYGQPEIDGSQMLERVYSDGQLRKTI